MARRKKQEPPDPHALMLEYVASVRAKYEPMPLEQACKQQIAFLDMHVITQLEREQKAAEGTLPAAYLRYTSELERTHLRRKVLEQIAEGQAPAAAVTTLVGPDAHTRKLQEVEAYVAEALRQIETARTPAELNERYNEIAKWIRDNISYHAPEADRIQTAKREKELALYKAFEGRYFILTMGNPRLVNKVGVCVEVHEHGNHSFKLRLADGEIVDRVMPGQMQESTKDAFEAQRPKSQETSQDDKTRERTGPAREAVQTADVSRGHETTGRRAVRPRQGRNASGKQDEGDSRRDDARDQGGNDGGRAKPDEEVSQRRRARKSASRIVGRKRGVPAGRAGA